MGITPAIIGAGAALASAGNSILGGGPGGSQATGQAFVPPNQQQAAGLYQNIYQSMFNEGQGEASTLMPQYQGETSLLTNNPFAPEALSGAQAAGAATPGVAGGQLAGSQQAFGQAQQFQPYINSVLQQGFDPQQALYQQLQSQTGQQANAVNAQNGLGNTPYGASVADNALNNFNVNWQNNLLSRQSSAAQTAGGLNQSMGLDLSTGSQLGTGALGTLVSGSAAPYTASTGQANTGLTGLGTLTNAYTSTQNLPQLTLQDLQSYLGLGQTAASNALSAAQANALSSQLAGQGLATSLSNPALSSSLNGLFGSSSPYTPSASYYSSIPSSSYYDPSGSTGFSAY